MRLKFARIPHSTAVKPYLWFGSFVGRVVTNRIYPIEANPVSPSAGAQLPRSAGSLLRWRLQPGSDERLSFVISLWQCVSDAVLRACAQSAFACLNDWLSREPPLDRLARVRFRCADTCPMLSLALSRLGYPLPRAPLPRAALNRGGAAREDLRACRRPTTRSGKLQRRSGIMFEAATLEKIVNELLEVPGNKSFRDAIEALARKLMRR
jgi:hypothetical protein